MRKKLNICVIFIMVLLCLSACAKKSYFSEEDNSEAQLDVSKNNSTKGNSSKGVEDKVFVQISGAVNCPGVYELPGDARVFHVILMAGGLRDDADDLSLNQAGKVSDGQKIVIMTKEEALLAASSNNFDGKVDINTADETTLMTLPGIGESKAKAIIKYRESNGPFGATEDIKNISGIKDGVYSKIEDMIKV